MSTKEKILNLLLKPFGLAVITQEEWKRGLELRKKLMNADPFQPIGTMGLHKFPPEDVFYD